MRRIGEEERVYLLMVGGPEGKRQLEIPIRRWLDNIKLALGKIRLKSIDRIGLVQDRDKWRDLVKAVMNIRVS
jgi:hypothetical protein